ncbi:hypothetical protein vseg_012844 [Gypsophila vaccaria]
MIFQFYSNISMQMVPNAAVVGCVAGILCALYSRLLYELFVPDWHIIKLSFSVPVSNSAIKCGLRGDLSPACNSAGMIDHYVLSINHLYTKPAFGNLKECKPTKFRIPESSPSSCHVLFDPEGILGNLDFLPSDNSF